MNRIVRLQMRTLFLAAVILLRFVSSPAHAQVLVQTQLGLPLLQSPTPVVGQPGIQGVAGYPEEVFLWGTTLPSPGRGTAEPGLPRTPPSRRRRVAQRNASPRQASPGASPGPRQGEGEARAEGCKEPAGGRQVGGEAPGQAGAGLLATPGNGQARRGCVHAMAFLASAAAGWVSRNARPDWKVPPIRPVKLPLESTPGPCA